MGCFSLQFLAACTLGSSRIKIMKVDGQCLKYDAPMYVKEVLVDYPGHAIFHSDTVRKLGNRARPLQGTLRLQSGQLYFLIPLPQRERSLPSRRPSSGTVSSSGRDPVVDQQQQEGQNLKRKVSFASTPSYMESSSSEDKTQSFKEQKDLSLSKPSVEVLPSPSSGVVRLKMVVSKRQLASVLKEGGDTVSMVEGLLSPLLREAEAARSDLRDTSVGEVRSNCAWRPALESIPESSCPHQLALEGDN